MKSLKKREIPIIGKITWEGLRKIKIVTKILPDTVKHNVSPPQAKKIIHLHLIRMGLLYYIALGPGTTCWPGGGSEMLSRGRGVKNGLQGGRMATYPPPHAHICLRHNRFNKV